VVVAQVDENLRALFTGLIPVIVAHPLGSFFGEPALVTA
jgi:hypothetical protein